ncbi:trypsin-like peptidase domain-containing protein [Streptomyces sp. NPDC005805]|uniref:S1C family serine protease n=1 Tax=Streptomyces sp. NPDC005805 TaxID=3157068 RepID=UPI0033FBB799
MSEDHRRSGDDTGHPYPQQPAPTAWAHTPAPHGDPYTAPRTRTDGAGFPPPPQEPPRPPVTVWPGDGGSAYVPGPGTTLRTATAGPVAPAAPGSRRRAKRPVALIAAVAIAAGAVGGAGSLLVDQLLGDRASGGTGGSVTGTNVSQSSKGTVAGVAQAVSPSIVEISASTSSGQSTGSGVIITSGGEIVTNNHVVSGADTVKVRLSDGRTFTADVVGTDPDKDLALIELRGASGLKAAALGDSGDVKVGDEVVAIGSPEGLTGTVTSGIVSALDRDVTVAKDEQRQPRQDSRQDWPFEFGGQEFNGDTGDSTTTYKAIQTDASLNPGNSGGALINMNGEIIGINSAMYSPSSANGSTAGSVGLGFAIPIDTVKADLDTLRSGGND